MKTAPALEPLELKTQFPFTQEYVNRAPFKDGVYSLWDGNNNPIAVGFGTLLNDMWREASLRPDTVKFFVIEKVNGTAKEMQEHVAVLRAQYGLVPEPAKRQIGFGRP